MSRLTPTVNYTQAISASMNSREVAIDNLDHFDENGDDEDGKLLIEAFYDGGEEGGACFINWSLVQQIANYPLSEIVDTQSADWDVKKSYTDTFILKSFCLVLQQARNFGFNYHKNSKLSEKTWEDYESNQRDSPLFSLETYSCEEDDVKTLLWGQDCCKLDKLYILLSPEIDWRAVRYVINRPNTASGSSRELSQFSMALAIIEARKLGKEEGSI
jgi:hypothetical protein